MFKYSYLYNGGVKEIHELQQVVQRPLANQLRKSYDSKTAAPQGDPEALYIFFLLENGVLDL